MLDPTVTLSKVLIGSYTQMYVLCAYFLFVCGSILEKFSSILSVSSLCSHNETTEDKSRYKMNNYVGDN